MDGPPTGLRKVVGLLQLIAFIMMLAGCLGVGKSPGNTLKIGGIGFILLTGIMLLLNFSEKKSEEKYEQEENKRLISAAKTNYTVRLIIDFYSRFEAAVRILSKQQSQDELERDIFIVFCMFLIRQMHNLGDTGGVDDAIGKALFRINHSNMTTFNIGDYIHATDIDIRVPNLVEYRGKGEKGFDFPLDYSYGDPSKPVAILDPWGFGSFGHEVNYYAAQSINALLRYMMVKSSTDEQRFAFCDAAKLCGEKYLSGTINFGSSQSQAAVDIFQVVYPDL